MPIRGAASMTRRAVSAPARCPAERGRPREVAHRPFPSEMMATCSRGACATAVWGVMFLATVSNTEDTPILRRKEKKLQTTLPDKVVMQNFFALALPRGPNKCFHMIEIA